MSNADASFIILVNKETSREISFTTKVLKKLPLDNKIYKNQITDILR